MCLQLRLSRAEGKIYHADRHASLFDVAGSASAQCAESESDIVPYEFDVGPHTRTIQAYGQRSAW